ncbi:F-box protein PP2-B10-like [Tasmannia lanceolata]|uniref:F-box protein PP2-B10-like n=1 Tax=Tasmannia lanceolata TaxID=3420 RepID=UPI004062D604
MEGADLFCKMPEGCISHTISFNSPRDACKSALVSLIFRSASNSDSVWENFLPSDYKEIISRSVSPVEFSSKKDLYFRLCRDPILIDNGKMSFSLERETGKKCYMLAARELLIVWGDTPRYWRWISLTKSRFPEVAELLSVCWLEIHGKINTRILSPNTTYVAYIVLKFVEGAHGLHYPSTELSIQIGGIVYKTSAYLLANDSQRLQHQTRVDRFNTLCSMRTIRPRLNMWDPRVIRVPRDRNDGWMEIELGEFFNDDGDQGEVEMSLMEVKSGNEKAGLIVQGIELRPKE